MKTYHLFQFGKGNIGDALIKQVVHRVNAMQTQYGFHFEYVGVCGQSKAVYDQAGLNEALEKQTDINQMLTNYPGYIGYPGPMAMLDIVLRNNSPNLFVIDATGAEMTDVHLTCLRQGIPVITANKKPIADDYSSYDEIQRLGRGSTFRYWYETTAGAGLPVISSIKELVDTGDTVLEIAGCLSGTLGYICSQLDTGCAFSDIVVEAQALGFTEPDPREDLNGMDVARKALILAREIGYILNMSDLHVDGMVSDTLLEAPSIDAFMALLSQEDEVYARRMAAAREQGQVLRYMATVKNGACQVGLQSVPLDSPTGSLTGPDNIVVCTTARYKDNPLVIRGPGAGPEVTAGGLFGDLIKAVRVID